MSKKQDTTGYKSAPTPGGNFVKLGVGMSVKGEIVSANMEIEKRKVKGKDQSKERFHFVMKLDEDTEVLVGKSKHEKPHTFEAGTEVILPEHGFLTTTMRRTACEIAGVSFNVEEDTNLAPLVGASFIIERLEDGEISSGPFAGKASALYDVKYRAPISA